MGGRWPKKLHAGQTSYGKADSPERGLTRMKPPHVHGTRNAKLSCVWLQKGPQGPWWKAGTTVGRGLDLGREVETPFSFLETEQVEAISDLSVFVSTDTLCGRLGAWQLRGSE